MSLVSQLAGESMAHGPKAPNGVVIIPYDARVDANASKMLPWMWERLRDEELLPLYFPLATDGSFSQFIKLMSGGERVLMMVAKSEDGSPDKVMGFGSWALMPFTSARAGMAGFIFFREFWDTRSTTDAALEGLRYWFEQDSLDVIVGAVAEGNVLANRFLPRLGLTRAGCIPLIHQWEGERCGSVLWAVTREEFARHYREVTSG